ncbi:hypothetical protein RB653_003172 [Dictyostelium firmibasis]|uniref:tRNA/rRNA methyltransferase SpoU type domain-containing protein n=1 Tax=Dictyostelium firmibasis TaxID=79012 RepID=A0AAN7TRU8_9MYCE
MISNFKILSTTPITTKTTNIIKSINLTNGERYFSKFVPHFKTLSTTPVNFENDLLGLKERKDEVSKKFKVYNDTEKKNRRFDITFKNNSIKRKNNTFIEANNVNYKKFDSSKYISNKPERRNIQLIDQAVYGINPVWVALSSENRTFNVLYICGSLLPKLEELGINIDKIENSEKEYTSDFNYSYGNENIEELNKQQFEQSEQQKQQKEEEEEEVEEEEDIEVENNNFKTINRYNDRKNLKALKEIVRNGFKSKIPVVSVNKGILDSFSKGRPHQGVILDASPLTLLNIDFLERFDANERLNNTRTFGKINRDKYPLWLVLDELWDPQNVGAIIRSCSFFNIDGVVISNKNTSPITPAASKSSSGACESFIINRTESIEGFLKSSQRNGWRVVGTSLDSNNENQPCVDINEVKLNEPTILVLGNEGFGLKPSILEICNKTIKISGGNYKIDSLNVSVTSGILIHTLLSSSTLLKN